MEGGRLLENFLWTRVDGRLHKVAENVDMHIRCHDTEDTSTICRIRLCASGQRVRTFRIRSGLSKVEVQSLLGEGHGIKSEVPVFLLLVTNRCADLLK